MQLVWPRSEREHLSEAELAQLYDYPPDRRWVVGNFVTSLDGGIEVGGRSGGLSNDADQRVFRLGRNLADVVLVGAGTATAEGYRGVRAARLDGEARRRHGLSAVPPLAVVTTGRTLPADSPAVTRTEVPSLILTCRTCPEDRRRAWAAAGADVLVTGDDRPDLHRGLLMLEERGLRRVDCEGGAHLFAALLRERLIDELRLTLSPLLLGGEPLRLVAGVTGDPTPARLASVLTDGDTVLLRYLVGDTGA